MPDFYVPRHEYVLTLGIRRVSRVVGLTAAFLASRQRKPSESAVARWQHELTADQPAAVTEAVERMWRDCVQRGVTGAAGGATAVAGNGDDDAAADRPDVASLQLDVWDFAGHAAYYTTHQVAPTAAGLAGADCGGEAAGEGERRQGGMTGEGGKEGCNGCQSFSQARAI